MCPSYNLWTCGKRPPGILQVTKVKFTWSPSAEPVASSPPEEVGSPHLRGDGSHPRREAKVAFTSHRLVVLAFSQHAFPKERPASADRFQLGQTYNTASLRLRATLPREMAGPPSVVALTQLGVPIPSAPKPCAVGLEPPGVSQWTLTLNPIPELCLCGLRM